jgi:spore germination protein GerM
MRDNRKASYRSAVIISAACALTLSACGVPDSGEARPLQTDQVPFDLLSPATHTRIHTDQSQKSPVSVPGLDELLVAFITTDGKLRQVIRFVSRDGTEVDRVQKMLDLISAGPTPQEREQGLESAIPSSLKLRALRHRRSTVTIDISGSVEMPATARLPLIVAQIAVTSTEVPGVETVLLEEDGRSLEAPLPSGELTSEPISAEDYAQLLLDD